MWIATITTTAWTEGVTRQRWKGVIDDTAVLPFFGVVERALAGDDFFYFVPEVGLLVLKPWLIWRGNDSVTLAMALSMSSGFSCV